jgi:hypothetical protein
MTDVSSVYAKARDEVASMLGYTDHANLSPEQSTRLDIGTSLRVLLDHQSGRLLRGESLDARELLLASDALAKLLPPLREPPPADAPDPRHLMWETYLGMRRRGELAVPESTYEGRGRRIAELEAEVAALKAGVPAPDEPGASGASNGAPGGNVVELSTRVDNPSPPAAPPKPAPQPQAAPWKDYVNSDGSIRSTPRGRWDV